jgi:hypothetical protein
MVMMVRLRAIIAAALALTGCTPLGLNTASTDFAREASARPGVLDAFGDDPSVVTREHWVSRRASLLRAAFEKHVYGPVPADLKGVEIDRKLVDPDYANGAGTLEEIHIRVGEGPDAVTYMVALAIPKTASTRTPAPLLINENFCGTAGTFGSSLISEGGCTNNGFMARIIRLIFGQYITEGPNEWILRQGYAYASLFPGAFAADDKDRAPADIARFGKLAAKGRAPEGVIAIWAAAFGWTIDVFDQDKRLDPARTAVWGHSRHGKSALVAAAWDSRIEAVISLQSGKGGATLTRSYAGESVKQMTKAYPHWFAPAYAAYADRERDIPVDQHQLLALIAPRPVMVGNGWKDVWSDPNGAFRAALGADPAFRLMGGTGLQQTGLRDVQKRGDIDFFIRPGGHGVRKADWDYMIGWLDRVMPLRPVGELAPLADAVTPPASVPQPVAEPVQQVVSGASPG